MHRYCIGVAVSTSYILRNLSIDWTQEIKQLEHCSLAAIIVSYIQEVKIIFKISYYVHK